MGGEVDISKLPGIPRRLSWPLRRRGLDPLPETARRRATEPVSKLGTVFGMNIWIVTGYAEARAVLMDTSSYSNDIRPLVASEGTSEAHSIGGLGFTDPPDHTRLRKFLTPEFTVRRLARMRPVISELVGRQLDALEEQGPVVDLVQDFAFPIPFQVICELLGVPEEDRTPFRELGPARFDLSHGGLGAFASAGASREFLLEVVRKQRADPGVGLIGSIIREHGDSITDLELGGLADGVLLGGYETSASMLALGTLVLLQDPEALTSVRTDPGAVDGIVEELLRYLAVVQIAFPRFARRDLELFGHHVSKGDMVACSLPGADRDDAFGPHPERFDHHRRPMPHLAFGQGLHRCVGAELARMELRTAFVALARRFPDLELAVDPSELRFRKLSIVYGVESLPVRLRATRGAVTVEGGRPGPSARSGRRR